MEGDKDAALLNNDNYRLFKGLMTNMNDQQIDHSKIFPKLNKHVTASVATDEPMEEEDNSRSEATFSFKITDVTNFFNSKDNRLSEPCFVRNLPWKIMAMPRAGPDRSSRSLGFFLQCNGESESQNWSCNAAAELRLISQTPGISDMVRTIDHHFFPKEVGVLFLAFVLLTN